MEQWQIERITRMVTRIKTKIRSNSMSLSFDEISAIVREDDAQPDVPRRRFSTDNYNVTGFKTATDEEIQIAIDELCREIPAFLVRADSLPKSRFKWFKYKVFRPPTIYQAPAPSPVKTTANKFEEKFRRKGRGICERCGGPMFGKGRHTKSRRGHTREICDIQLVQEIMES
jgi:hypothetical protein